ncbi:MAG: cupin domain-containing protein [Atopobium sp.]|nr:cupin domain-containing protein [Atopobium sp.]
MSEHIKPGVMKNINAKEVMVLKDQVTCLPGQVISKTLAQNDHISVTLFAFGAREEIASHRAGGDAFVTALEGKVEITIDDDTFVLEAGNSIVMPLGHPHALKALEDFKMMLVIIYPENSRE